MRVKEEMEIEYKNELTKSDFTRLTKGKTRPVHYLYYLDTEDFKYAKKASSIRVYIVDDTKTYAMDFKKYVEDNVSVEYNYEFKNKKEAEDFIENPDPKILKKLGIKDEVIPFVKAHKYRADIEYDVVNVIEVVVDKTIFEPLYDDNKGRFFIDYEVEMEVKEKDENLFFKFLRDNGIKYRSILKKQQRALEYFYK
jgi:uncharacterized protein YjbK